jgi:hypothetical protein
MCYSEHYVEDNPQHVDGDIVAGMECVSVNINGKYFSAG